ncbi:MAG: hypothetical protein GTN74_17555 [Proteobacteria bacterium]|nr:hypothetical protein [Pseudomonadota bacterium]
MPTYRHTRYLKIGISCALILLAILYWADIFEARTKVDQNLLLIIAAAVLVAIIPWEWLQSLKAGPLEFAINRPQVQNVLNKIGLDRIENETLRQFLANHSSDLEAIAGSRILWIDDRPEEIVGQRRLFRALRLEIVTAISTNDAVRLLHENPDFDLIITDIQRGGESYLCIEGYRDHSDADRYTDHKGITWYKIHEGVNFIVSLHRDKARDERISGELVKKIPVIFYAAYDRKRLVEFTRPVRDLIPEVDICNDPNSLVAKTIARLSEIHARPIQYPTAKVPTAVRGGTTAPDGAEAIE